MTLKEKFKKIDIKLSETHSTLITNREADIMEKIADEFAIGFAEWCIEHRVEFVDDTKEGILYTYEGMYKKYIMKELLEIYKKEKKL